MTLKNATRWIRVLSLFGLAFAIACEPDLTNPGRTTKPHPHSVVAKRLAALDGERDR